VHDGDDGPALAARFAELHAARSGYTLPRPVEVVSARHAASTPSAAPRFVRAARAGEPGAAFARGGHARVLDASAGAGDVVRGPASIALADATVLVPGGWTARALEVGGWMLEAS
jgi:N-methylhydantoinase A